MVLPQPEQSPFLDFHAGADDDSKDIENGQLQQGNAERGILHTIAATRNAHQANTCHTNEGGVKQSHPEEGINKETKGGKARPVLLKGPV